MATFQIAAQQKWPCFSYQGVDYPLDHLNASNISFNGEKHKFNFVVTYGLHCFAKDENEDQVEKADCNLNYRDGRESRPFSFERYEMSKQLPSYIKKLHTSSVKVIGGNDKYRVIEIVDHKTGEVKEYKIGFVCFKENRLLRLHVTTAFIENRPNLVSGTHKNTTIFNIGLDLIKRPKSHVIPKEAKNRR